ncbi:unnamed protein product [Ambrosiozyma monospora]|uniref:Unnamed protein product n=1 Tax=Ambrosiozyma monospora TaxID=43982 RepID=A0A9W6Z6Z9_AMBMO|nr:unnamed protein product [Ambrosiozyma monospora]
MVHLCPTIQNPKSKIQAMSYVMSCHVMSYVMSYMPFIKFMDPDSCSCSPSTTDHIPHPTDHIPHTYTACRLWPTACQDSA